MGPGMLVSIPGKEGTGMAVCLLPPAPPPLSFHQDPSAFAGFPPQTSQPSINQHAGSLRALLRGR